MNVSIVVAVLTDADSEDGRSRVGNEWREAAVVAARTAGAVVVTSECAVVTVPRAFLDEVHAENGSAPPALVGRVVHRVDFGLPSATPEQLFRFAEALALDTIARRPQAPRHFAVCDLDRFRSLAMTAFSGLAQEGVLMPQEDPALDALLREVRRHLQSRPTAGSPPRGAA